MNFLDPTDITTLNGTATPPPRSEDDPTFNEEVTQVIGQLGSFWGGLRKQSQAALESARSVDFGNVVTQAQKEITKLTATTEAVPAEKAQEDASAEGDVKDDSESGPDRSPTPTLPSSSSSTLFSRLQSALPPNIVSTVQSAIPESVKHASEHGIDFTALRGNLQNEFTRVQGLTRTQAEEYVRQSEILLRETFNEAQEVLRDAVKVVPPDEASSSNIGVLWDGSDVWMLPYDPGEAKGKEVTKPLDSQRAVATRTKSLLRRLKHDSAIIRHDPEADPAVKEMYAQWLAADVEGGIESAAWTEKAEQALNETSDGAALKANHDTLVPGEMTDDIFWKRYFFRVHQTEREEQKRKALLADSNETEDDFTWEDDEDEPSSPTSSKPTSAPAAEVVQPDSAVEGKTPSTPATLSPRESSEESYDVVSSGNASAAAPNSPTKGKSSKDGDDSDSDWE